MSIRTEQELEVTREKLRWLEGRVATLKLEPAENLHVRQLTLQSLGRLVKQLKEEIIRYEIQVRRRAKVRLEESERRDSPPQVPPAPAGQPEPPLETSP